MTLTTKEDGGRERPACPSCSFIHYGDFSIGCAGVVVKGDRMLLVQRGQNPFAGSWQIPGGYAEADENISLAVEREVMEEAGIEAKVRDVIAFRHAVGGGAGGPSTNIYVIFRLDLVGDAEPVADGVEIAQAGFYTRAEMDEMEGVQSMSKWAIDMAVEAGDNDFGLRPDPDAPGASRFNWGMFGIGPRSL
jgi:ADP-ribose pyrophosphatase YjhB (NUDIX family)